MEKIEKKSKSKDEGVKSSLDKRNSVFTSLKKYRKQFEANWKEEEKAYYGDLWKNSNENRPYENHVFKTIEAQVPILTDSMPAPAVRVNDPAYLEQASNLGKAIEWVNKDQNFELNYSMLVRNQLVTGTSWLHTYYDANENGGDGCIKDEILHWSKVWLSGRGAFIEDCDKARIELDRTRDWLMLNYPRHKDKLKSAKAEKVSQDTENDGFENYDNVNRGAKKGVPKQYHDDDTLCLVKTYCKDYSLVKIPEEQTAEELTAESEALESGESPDVTKWQDHAAHIEAHNMVLQELYSQLGVPMEAGLDEAMRAVDAMAEENPEADLGPILSQIAIMEAHNEEHKVLLEENPNGEKPKYSNYLRVIETVNEILLYDGEPRDEHGEVPLVPFYTVKDGNIYAIGGVRFILDPMRMHATMMFKEYKGLQRVANPEKHVDQETGLTAKDITNEDGAVYVIPQGTTIRNIDPGSVSPQVGAFQVDRVRTIQDISGVNEATEGKMPSPNASGVTVERTQQQAIGRIRLIDRQNQYYSIKRLAKLRASMILQYWTGEKILKLENEGGDYSQLIFNPLEFKDISYEIEISSGSMAGVDKDSFNALMASFLNAGHITFDEFLQVAEIPRREKVRELVSSRADQSAQIEELQTQLIKLKGSVDPTLLNPEEKKIYEEMQREQQLEQLQGVNADQPFLGEQ